MPDVDGCGLEDEQVKSLKRTFDQFDSDKSGAISVGTVDVILKMMGMHVSTRALDEIIEEIDEDGSGELEFPEFIQLAAKFLIEEDEEEMKWELKEAFRLYDKQGKEETQNVLKPKKKMHFFFAFFRKWLHNNQHFEGNSAGNRLNFD